MQTGLKQLCCGNCGFHGVELFTVEGGGLLAECMECKSTTDISITKPQFSFRFASEASKGILCQMEKKPQRNSP